MRDFLILCLIAFISLGAAFTTNEQVTSTKLNELDNANIKASAGIDPEKIDDTSETTTEQDATSDPYVGDTQTLATDLEGEVQQLRFQIEQILQNYLGASSTSNWYTDPVFKYDTQFGNLLEGGSFEVWPAGTSAVPEGWMLGGVDTAVAREGTIVKHGSYSAKVTRANATSFFQVGDNVSSMGETTYIQGRTFTFGEWVYASAASTARLIIGDGVANTYSSYHTGGSNWEWLTVTRTCAGAASQFQVGGVIDVNSEVVYFDGATLVEGSLSAAFSEHPRDFPIQSKVIAFSRTAAAGSGDQAVTGAGFAPSVIIITAVPTANQQMSLGISDDALNELCLNSRDAASFYVDSTFIIYIKGGADIMEGGTKSLDADGFTITWTKTASGHDMNCAALCLR